MAYFESVSCYVEQATTLQDRIIRLDSIIDALMFKAMDSAGNMDITEYSLDDGQTKIRGVYRNSVEIFTAINSYERLKQMYINRLYGRSIRLVDGQNFIG